MASTRFFNLAAFLLLAVSVRAVSAKSGALSALLSESEIKKLSICYAYGVDAIGSGKGVEAARKILRPCFTKDVTFIISGNPDFVVQGVDEWTIIVRDAFARPNYTATQHMIGSQSVTFVGKGKAEQTSYLIATHVFPDKNLGVFNGFYTDLVVRRKGVWKIKTRTLTQQSYLKIAGTPIGI